MNGALIVTWSHAHRGQEAASVDLMQRSIAFWDDLVKSGRLTSRKIYLMPMGGPPGGMLVAEGELDTLNQIFWDKDYKRFHVQARAIFESFEATVGVGGEPETLLEPITLHNDAIAELDNAAP